MGKKGLEWKGERDFYLLHVICRFLLAVNDLCGRPPNSGSSVGCCVFCCVFHVDSELCGKKFLLWLSSSNPPSTIFCPAYPSASRWCKPGYLQVFTEPMGKAGVLAIPNSGFFWCSFPLSCQHLYLLYSPARGRHQTLYSQIPLNSSASMSNTPEYNYTVFFSREVRIPAI